ncbi:MAG: hypothetical protein ACTHU0_05190 [Kofleriaceae bacterium]
MSAGLRAACVVAAVAGGGLAHADRYEATIAVRPVGALARVDDTGVAAAATVPSAGLAAGMSWGVRNWLDLGGELAALDLAEARYDGAMATVFGQPQSGRLSRTTRLAQLRGTATLRLGVGWVPTFQLALGAGGRQRSAAQLRLSSLGGATVPPDGEAAEVTGDLVAAVRIGLDHRVTRHWSAGISVGATHCLGLGAPDLQIFDASVGVAYTWYPLW